MNKVVKLKNAKEAGEESEMSPTRRIPRTVEGSRVLNSKKKIHSSTIVCTKMLHGGPFEPNETPPDAEETSAGKGGWRISKTTLQATYEG